MLSLDCIVQRNPNIFAAEADRDLVMVSIPNGFYYSLSDVAREIWEAIESPKKISASHRRSRGDLSHRPALVHGTNFIIP